MNHPILKERIVLKGPFSTVMERIQIDTFRDGEPSSIMVSYWIMPLDHWWNWSGSLGLGQQGFQKKPPVAEWILIKLSFPIRPWKILRERRDKGQRSICWERGSGLLIGVVGNGNLAHLVGLQCTVCMYTYIYIIYTLEVQRLLIEVYFSVKAMDLVRVHNQQL